MFYYPVVSQNTCLSSPELRVLVIEHDDQLAHTLWHMFRLVPKYVTDVTNEWKLMPLQFRVPSVSNWLGFKLLRFETEIAEQGLRSLICWWRWKGHWWRREKFKQSWWAMRMSIIRNHFILCGRITTIYMSNKKCGLQPSRTMSHPECRQEDRNFAQPDLYAYETGLKLRG